MSETWGWAPLIALMFVGALGSISTDIFNAAKIDGATNWEVFRHITLPLLKPVILIVTLLKTIFSLKMFDQVVTMTGGGTRQGYPDHQLLHLSDRLWAKFGHGLRLGDCLYSGGAT